MVWRPWWQKHILLCESFIKTAKSGDYESVAKMINVDYAGSDAVNVNYQDADGKTALHYAVEANDCRLVNLLVQNYADVRC
jgi:ankyrin repeat protein